MPRYEVTTTVELIFEIEADNLEEAEKAGWEWEDYIYTAQVDSIEVYEYPEEDEED